jgi:hypothetical protein
MLALPSLLPPGTSYVRIPRSKSATQRVILEIVQRGSRYWTSGVIPIEKALRLADKFAHQYGTAAKQSKRAWDKAHGRANSTLIMYPEDDRALTPLRWWLLVTPGQGLVHQQEQLHDAWDKRPRLQWGEQYELVHLQKDRRFGGGRHWTWRLTEQRYAELEAAMRQYASAHGAARSASAGSRASGVERSDDLGSLIVAITRMPGFHGIRVQQLALYRSGKEAWDRTHRAPYSGWPGDVPYVDKRQWVYHRPHPLTLDVIMQIYQARRAALQQEIGA